MKLNKRRVRELAEIVFYKIVKVSRLKWLDDIVNAFRVFICWCKPVKVSGQSCGASMENLVWFSPMAFNSLIPFFLRKLMILLVLKCEAEVIVPTSGKKYKSTHYNVYLCSRGAFVLFITYPPMRMIGWRAATSMSTGPI